MRNDGAAVKWYRNRIHQKQREASALSIEVGLDAQDKLDPGALSETMKCLETAIGILEQAKTIKDVEAEPDCVSDAQELMEDLGHSMAPLDFGQRCYRRIPRAPHKSRKVLQFVGARTRHDARRGAGWEDSIQFFE